MLVTNIYSRKTHARQASRNRSSSRANVAASSGPNPASAVEIEPVDGRWLLTAAGRHAHDAILRSVSEVRRTVTDGIAPHDYATTLATLEHIVNNLAAIPGAQDAAGSRIA
jgi:hypothetical protein